MAIFNCALSLYGCDGFIWHEVDCLTGEDALRRAMAAHGGTPDQWRIMNTEMDSAITYATLRRATAETAKDREFWHRLIGSLRKAAAR